MKTHSYTFTINDYDKDGDIFDAGIFLHFGDTRIKVGKTMDDLDYFIRSLKEMKKEIKENYDIK
jgi:hypothetical protein